MDGAACAKAGGRKELGTFKTGKEVRVAGMQGQGLGEGERHTEAMSQRASRNLTGAAKELAFPRRAVGTTGAQGAAGRGWDAGEDAAPRPSWVTPDVWVPLSNLVFLQSAVREREGGRESVCVSVSVCCVCV